MDCPFCQTLANPDAPECPACRLTYPRTAALLGALPRLEPEVADTTGLITVAEQAKLRSRLRKIEQRFPQAVLQIIIHHFPQDYPFSLHAFWIFNAGNFAGQIKRGKDNHALLIALDPSRREAAIVPGYGLETLLPHTTLDHLLELATPSWQKSRWADGILQVLDGLDLLLESVAIPEVPSALKDGEF